MAFPGARRLTFNEHRYEWVVRRQGNDLRVVVQDVLARGQLLVVKAPYFTLWMSGDQGVIFTRA